MRLIMRSLCAGPDGVFHPGQVVDVPSEAMPLHQAQALVAGGYAVWVGLRPGTPETAMLALTVEHAVRPAPTKGRGGSPSRPARSPSRPHPEVA